MGKKVSYSKLQLSLKDNGIDVYFWNKQPVEIKQYIPVEEKLEIVSNIINSSIDDNGYYNYGKVEIFTCLEIIYNYTNISFTEKQKENPTKLYDCMIFEGFFDKIISLIPEEEIKFIRKVTKETIKSIYSYKNSVAGIMETISQDYSDLNFDVTELHDKIKDPENLALLKSIVTQLG